MEKSSNIKLKPVFDKPLPNDFVFANSKQNAAVYATDKYAAIRLSVTTSDKISIETYVFAKTKHGNFVSITADESLTKFSDVNKQDKIMKLPVPRCLYELLWQDFGGDDNGLRISDRPLRLRKSDVPMMTKILKRNLCPEKPIIYITPSQSTGDYVFDAYEIAAALPGIAHVIVADNPFVSELISNAIGVPDAIADNGEAMVILPDGQSYKLTDDDTPAAMKTKTPISVVGLHINKITVPIIIRTAITNSIFMHNMRPYHCLCLQAMALRIVFRLLISGLKTVRIHNTSKFHIRFRLFICIIK